MHIMLVDVTVLETVDNHVQVVVKLVVLEAVVEAVLVQVADFLFFRDIVFIVRLSVVRDGQPF